MLDYIFIFPKFEKFVVFIQAAVVCEFSYKSL